MRRRAHHRGVAVARRHPDDGVAFRQHHVAGDEEGRGLAIAQHQIVPRGIAAELVQAEGTDAIVEQCGGDLVIEEVDVVGLDPHAAVEAVQDVDRLAALGLHAPPHHRPGGLQLLQIVDGGADDLAARVGDLWGEFIAETIACHGMPPELAAPA